MSVVKLETYSKHWKLSVVVKKGLLFSQLLILAQTFAEEMPDTSMACQHETTNLTNTTYMFIVKKG